TAPRYLRTVAALKTGGWSFREAICHWSFHIYHLSLLFNTGCLLLRLNILQAEAFNPTSNDK
ncbi:MAG TPA: hypothetical protein VJV03_11870, partial [Pyrinomonadaceae bacterium]|nr:hypothetical protein [Pyrinomonadaceae bacterium]